MDITVLNRYVKEKRLKRHPHKTLPLFIWNYTEITQAKKLWDDITLACRGLITDTNGTIVARSFPKFFNEPERPYESTPEFAVEKKVDGSLVVLFCYKGEWIMASRGAFDSPQAGLASQLLNERYPTLVDHLDADLAYSFELVHPENRIIVDYGSDRKLVFLAAFHRDGVEVDRTSLTTLMRRSGVELVPSINIDSFTIIADLRAHNTLNEEGYVVRFTTGLRIKVKFARYLDLDRIARKLTPRRVLDLYTAGVPTFEDLCEKERIPDEFMSWVRAIWENIDRKYAADRVKVEAEYEGLVGTTRIPKPEFQELIKKLDFRKPLSAMYDGQDPRKALLKMINPNKMVPGAEEAYNGGS
ncbi:RNA ligase-domain-containing protein [Fimicolochytrium jonesii]|uniref:RNA ligase-domain-containing protein n=1 Tax=Fimicolochytrium jonesii TaxID=1396493 RepID=UPI0022FE3CE1|nr:RNA ligase-domain-containing protein [Fimicolochytrium jonesii]KAI8821006.1 RNA ligase-domain-containing protein [Fimicolochytrium jonesii]